jgi:hypothetical protein
VYNYEMKYCRRCQQTKPTAEFYLDKSYPSGIKTSCKACISQFAKNRRAIKGTRRQQWDKHAERVTIFVYRLFLSYDGSKPLEIPVRRIGHVVPLPSGCLIRPRNGQNNLLIMGRLGYAEYMFEMVGPHNLAGILKEYNLEVVLPEESTQVPAQSSGIPA